MFIYNVHAPTKTFALAAKEKEDCAALIDRIVRKSGMRAGDADAVRSHRDGAGVVYEFDGDRWALEDDDDLAIVTARFVSEAGEQSSPSITLHVVLPQVHSDAIQASPPAYASASAQLQARTQKSQAAKSSKNGSSRADTISVISASPARKKPVDALTASTHLGIPNAEKNRPPSRARSVRSAMSTRSRRSKWGDDDAEPLGDVKRRQFNEFQANNGVRTVVGKVGNVNNVRMLLKAGYRHVYLSRAFATRHGLISNKQTPGMGGYTGLRILGNVPITVGSKEAYHPAMLSEEQHFDVVLGRSWMEKMNVKVDPLDPTALTYMDTGETIPCDLVVLRDGAGEIVTIT